MIKELTKNNMIKARIILIVAFFFSLISDVLAIKYYVSNTKGDDSKDGRSIITAWKTISKVNDMSFSFGDSILFNKGDVWRETLILPSSGSFGNYITFCSYGIGDKPKILGSNQSVSWVNKGGFIWCSTTSFTDPYAVSTTLAEVFFEELDANINWGIHKTNLGDLSNEYEWTWSSNYVYIYSPTDPNTRYTSIEVPQRDRIIYINDKDFITIDGFDLRFAKSRTIQTEYPQKNTRGLTIKNCHISHVGSRFNTAGIGSLGYHLAIMRNDMLIQNNEIHDGGRRNTSFHIYGSQGITISNIIIEGNNLHDGYHSSGVGLPLDGWETDIHLRNIIIRNNLIWDSPTRNPIVDGFDTDEMCTIKASTAGNSITNVQIYNNIFKYVNQSGILLDKADSVNVYNNTFYDLNHNISTGINMYQIEIKHACHVINIKNNIFYSTILWSHNSSAHNIVLGYQTIPSEIYIDYNLFYQKDPDVALIFDGTSYYRTSGSKPWSSIKTDRGWQINEPGLVDPLFAPNSEYQLQAKSPAIGAGIIVGIKTDFDGTLYNINKPSIGAYEGNPIEPTPPILPEDGDQGNQSIIVFPNPTDGYFNILRETPSLEAQTIKVYNLAGEVVFTDSLEIGILLEKLPVLLNSGTYIVQVLMGIRTISVQKLIVIK